MVSDGSKSIPPLRRHDQINKIVIDRLLRIIVTADIRLHSIYNIFFQIAYKAFGGRDVGKYMEQMCKDHRIVHMKKAPTPYSQARKNLLS